MLTVDFHDLSAVEDNLFQYAVIVSRHQGKWVFCKHKERDTWEIPGGRREPGEAILDTAKRELFEESGALEYALSPVCAYCVTRDAIRYGLLCYAEIKTLGTLPSSEMERIGLFDTAPQMLTYPLIQPLLLERVKQWIAENESPVPPGS